MRKDAIKLEDGRLEGLNLQNYPWYNERHRIFPEIFSGKRYLRILDIAAGVGIVGKRISDKYDCFMLCNDISKKSLENLKKNKLNTISFDLDFPDYFFPFKNNSFDAVISLATIEHIINIDEHLKEIHRVLQNNGHLYISAPNYSGIQFIIPFILTGKTFHNPVTDGLPKYEFYAHVRYFTYKTLLEFIPTFGFNPECVYLPLPKESSRYFALKTKFKIFAVLFRFIMFVIYKLFSPRWAFHPVLCFSKTNNYNIKSKTRPPKIII